MRDQATDLRNLVLRSARSSAARSGPAPRLTVVAGGRRGVGATTVAVNVAVALSQQAYRVVLVDACLDNPQAAALCGVASGDGINDVLAARRDIHEILVRGPAGIQIAPNRPAIREMVRRGEAAERRLVDQIKTLGRHADIVVLDIGSCGAARYWRAADLVAFVTTPDSAAVMDSYAAIKTVLSAGGRHAIGLIVNRASSESDAHNAHERIDRSCQRFLKVGVDSLGSIPDDPEVVQAALRAHPMITGGAGSPAAAAIEQIAKTIANMERAA